MTDISKFSGLGFGCVYIATNLYVAECAPARLRGSFVGTVSQFGYQLGSKSSLPCHQTWINQRN